MEKKHLHQLKAIFGFVEKYATLPNTEMCTVHKFLGDLIEDIEKSQNKKEEKNE